MADPYSTIQPLAPNKQPAAQKTPIALPGVTSESVTFLGKPYPLHEPIQGDLKRLYDTVLREAQVGKTVHPKPEADLREESCSLEVKTLNAMLTKADGGAQNYADVFEVRSADWPRGRPLQLAVSTDRPLAVFIVQDGKLLAALDSIQPGKAPASSVIIATPDREWLAGQNTVNAAVDLKHSDPVRIIFGAPSMLQSRIAQGTTGTTGGTDVDLNFETTFKVGPEPKSQTPAARGK